MQRTLVAMLAGLAVSTVASFAHAQGVGNLPALPTTIMLNSGNAWVVGPVDVVRDPNGPKWVKKLTDPNGGPILAAPGQVFSLQEHLNISGNLPWADWHEEILTPGWVWKDPSAMLANSAPPSNLSITNSGTTLSFVFDPLYPGTKVDIRKQLQYVGTTGALFNGVISIAEYPTPEPASLALLAIGSLGLLRRRHKA